MWLFQRSIRALLRHLLKQRKMSHLAQLLISPETFLYQALSPTEAFPVLFITLINSEIYKVLKLHNSFLIALLEFHTLTGGGLDQNDGPLIWSQVMPQLQNTRLWDIHLSFDS